MNFVTRLYVCSLFHGITIRLRMLKRRLVDQRLNKIGSYISDASLQVIIEREVGPSFLKEYRNIWNKLRVIYGIKVPRDKVMEILRNIDPVSFALKILTGKKHPKIKKIKYEKYE